VKGAAAEQMRTPSSSGLRDRTTTPASTPLRAWFGALYEGPERPEPRPRFRIISPRSSACRGTVELDERRPDGELAAATMLFSRSRRQGGLNGDTLRFPRANVTLTKRQEGLKSAFS